MNPGRLHKKNLPANVESRESAETRDFRSLLPRDLKTSRPQDSGPTSPSPIGQLTPVPPRPQ
jgi:hypothetical protein